MTFEEAYATASGLRNRLGGAGGLTTIQLREKVADYLIEIGFGQYIEAYHHNSIEQSRVSVVTSDGSDSPFSKGQLADSLAICALPQDSIYEVATAVENELLAKDIAEVSTKDLTSRVLWFLRELVGNTSADNYNRWVEFSHQDRPLIILIGGTTGSGKSSISSELAHSLDIVRTQSTDMLREVMRLLIPERLLPTLHTSTFEAYASLPTADSDELGSDMINGYLTQSSQVAVGVEGVLGRSAQEQVSLIIEGVHLHPELMRQIAEETDALVVPVLLAVLKAKRLKKRLKGRGHAIQTRRSERYLESFDQIWQLQSFLLSEADTFNVPIVPNDDEDQCLRAILQTVSSFVNKA